MKILVTYSMNTADKKQAYILGEFKSAVAALDQCRNLISRDIKLLPGDAIRFRFDSSDGEHIVVFEYEMPTFPLLTNLVWEKRTSHGNSMEVKTT